MSNLFLIEEEIEWKTLNVTQQTSSLAPIYVQSFN